MDVIASDPDLCQGDPSFTPDGARLVYARFDPAVEVEEIWSMKVDGSDQRRVTGAGGPDPNVSPDGLRLSFKGGDVGELFVQNMDGTGLVQVSPTVSVAFKSDWAPDGHHLVLSDDSEPGPTEPVNIAVVRPNGTDLTYVTRYIGPVRAFVGGYSPDGQWIVFRLEENGLNTLYRMRPDGSDLHAILSRVDLPSSQHRLGGRGQALSSMTSVRGRGLGTSPSRVQPTVNQIVFFSVYWSNASRPLSRPPKPDSL